MGANRGFDVTTSKSRDLLIEAADTLLWEQGGQAISARRVADQAGLKPQLVHYYFRSMEDLLIEVFRRATAQYAELHERALSAEQPVRALWDLNSNNRADTKRSIEFVALGNSHERLRVEMLQSGEHFRALQMEAVTHALEKAPQKVHYAAAGLAALMAAVARAIVMETKLGMSLGHKELSEMIENILDEIEPLTPDAKG